ncbi:epithelial sodium channel subunit alpha-like isoform X1 [Tachypleus tridentatus]|uniref:epithelial sodium channel subunit alpha-like isoform X1 n=1 Tax=Tachypleus tridentatus TaxID=6853 RepID=UPI003FD548DB
MIHNSKPRTVVPEQLQSDQLPTMVKEDPNVPLREFFKSLLERSNVNGVSHIASASSVLRQSVWVLVLVLGLFGCIYESYQFLKVYYTYPVVVTLDVENNWTLPFPSLTICNLNRVRRNSLNISLCEELKISLTICQRLFAPEKPVSSGPTALSGRNKYASCDEFREQKLSARQLEQLNFLTHFAAMNATMREQLGHSLEKLVRESTFNGEQCSTSNFSRFLTFHYGNCYTFNYQNDSDEPLMTQSIGPNSGLSLELDLEVDEYTVLSPSLGFRVVIHPPQTPANPEEDGYDISPGFESSFALKQTTITRLPSPFNDNCHSYGKKSHKSDLPNIKFTSGSQESCIKKCLHLESLRRCGCTDPFLSVDPLSESCDLSNRSQVCCLDEVLNYFKTNDLPCDCPLPCRKTYYDVSTSSAWWPSPLEQNYLVRKETYRQRRSVPASQLPPLPSPRESGGISTFQKLRTSKAKVKVYFHTLEHVLYKQVPVYQDSELFGQLGGQMGLWLGISLVALFECLETVALLVHFLCMQKRKNV